MSDIQYRRLFAYLNKEFGDIKADFADLRMKFDRLQTTADSIIKQQEIDQDERLVMSSQLDRHQAWISRVAKRLKIKYDHVL